MVQSHSRTNIQRVMNIKKSRALALIVLIGIAAAIFFLDRKDTKSTIPEELGSAQLSAGAAMPAAAGTPVETSNALPTEVETKPVMVIAEPPQPPPLPPTTTGPLFPHFSNPSVAATEPIKAKEGSSLVIKFDPKKEDKKLVAQPIIDFTRNPGKAGPSKKGVLPVQTPVEVRKPASDTKGCQYHTVAPGDIPCKISEQYYQTSGYGEAICKYNETRASKLKIGQQLAIPPLEIIKQYHTGQHPRITPKGSQAPKYIATTPSGKAKLALKDEILKDEYIVRKSDTLTGIASKTGCNFLVLYELNRDRFSDPDKLQEGMKIRLSPRR